jgi:hypothetical protein
MPARRAGVTVEGIAMAIAGAHHNPQLHAVGVSGTDLVDRWTLTGISPCCACTRDGRAARRLPA